MENVQLIKGQPYMVKHTGGIKAVRRIYRGEETGVCDIKRFVFSAKVKKGVFAEVEEVTVLNSITVDSGIFGVMGKAVKFISKDGLRPAMTCVCLDFENYKCEVVATDAHRLYLSPKFEGSEKSRVQVLLTEQTAKIKPYSELTEISILDNDRIMVNGEIYGTIDARFPDYRCVMPDYKMDMQFEVKPFIANVKKVLPYANKWTEQVNLHLNGSISLHTQDVDFSFECNADMPYITKNFPDTDIAFNGKFLIESLGIFKEKTIQFKTDGLRTQAGIFTNNTDTVLIMPLMLNN